MDRKYHATMRGQQEPLEARLEQLCGDSGLQSLVVERFGEASQNLHPLVKARALYLSRTSLRSRDRGYPRQRPPHPELQVH